MSVRCAHHDRSITRTSRAGGRRLSPVKRGPMGLTPALINTTAGDALLLATARDSAVIVWHVCALPVAAVVDSEVPVENERTRPDPVIGDRVRDVCGSHHSEEFFAILDEDAVNSLVAHVTRGGIHGCCRGE